MEFMAVPGAVDDDCTTGIGGHSFEQGLSQADLKLFGWPVWPPTAVKGLYYHRSSGADVDDYDELWPRSRR